MILSNTLSDNPFTEENLNNQRGFLGAGVDEPYAIVQLYRNNETEPNVRATEQELFEGLEA